jgi:hypothetical protein
MQRKSLSEILHTGNGGSWIDGDWNAVSPAPELAPLPAGKYVGHLVDKGFDRSSRGTPGVKLTFTVVEGEHTGRKLWLDVWLTEAAAPQARRDLAKLGITNKAQLEAPLVSGKRARCELTVIVQQADSGNVFNVVKRFEVLGIDDVPQEPADPFAPPADATAPAADAGTPPPVDPAAPRPSLFTSGKLEKNGSHLRDRL